MTLISDHFANYRRLYEGKEYLMKCLTRMYHLRDSETKYDATSIIFCLSICFLGSVRITIQKV